MRSNKTSILIINTEGKRNKPLLVPTKILLHWKRYFGALLFVILILVTALGFTIYRQTSAIYEHEIAKADKIKSLINVSKAQQTFKSIDESIFRINKLLETKGIVEIDLKNMGGPENIDVLKINELTDFYQEQLEELEETLKSVPIGSPTLSGKIISNFGYRKNPFTGYGVEYHYGIDIKGERGTPIKTTANGVVELARWNGGYGKCVIVKHENNLKTLYGHLSEISVKEGEKIECGSIVGKLGNTGRSTGPHLHYEIIKNGEKLNPIKYVKIHQTTSNENKE